MKDTSGQGAGAPDGAIPGNGRIDDQSPVDEDLGEPIAELAGMEEPVSKGFLGRILGKLQRRSLIGHLATMAWTASALAFFEFLEMVFSVVDQDKTPNKEGPTNG